MNLVAGDLAANLAEAFPPGRSQIFLKQSGIQNDQLGPALEQALRSKGFTLAAEPGSKVMTVAYVFDRANENIWYSRLSVSTGLLLVRTYQQNGSNLEMMAITKTETPGAAYGPK